MTDEEFANFLEQLSDFETSVPLRPGEDNAGRVRRLAQLHGDDHPTVRAAAAIYDTGDARPSWAVHYTQTAYVIATDAAHAQQVAAEWGINSPGAVTVELGDPPPGVPYGRLHPEAEG